MLTLLPTRPDPLRPDAAREELLHLWDGLDADGRRIVLSHARAVAETTGRARRVAARAVGQPAS